MTEADSGVVWRRRVASVVAWLHAGYVAVAAGAVVWLSWTMWQAAQDGHAGAGIALFFFAIPFFIGLVIAGLIIAWLISVAINLWRGKAWARKAGIATFAVVAAFLLMQLIAGPGARFPRDIGSLLLAFVPPAVGLWVLLTGASDFAVPGAMRRRKTTAMQDVAT